VPVVAGAALADAAELRSLRRGDAWLPGSGWWIDREGKGRGALLGARSELGVAVDLASDGRIVLRGDRVSLSVDPNGAMADSDQTTGQLADVVLDQPIVVRVELGAVTLTAREWAALRAGDVIETGRRVAEPVALRVAGREVARGELVNVEGELGVRILEILEGASSA
jgi:flagellar motor switch/type III secretory pathway protein FliN